MVKGFWTAFVKKEEKEFPGVEEMESNNSSTVKKKLGLRVVLYLGRTEERKK